MRKRLLITCCVVLVGLLVGRAIARAATPSKIRYWFASVTAPRAVDGYIRSHPLRMVQIGAGLIDLPGWLNTDIEPRPKETYLDATRHFPMPDGSINYIFGEHLIEHLTYEEGLGMFRECYRVLAPGGRIRIATPNLLKYVQLFQDPKSPEVQRYIDAKLKFHGWERTAHPETEILNLELRSWGHQFVYDPATLSDSMRQAGFQNVTEFAPGESDDPQLRGIEFRHKVENSREMNDYESMVLQAVRP